MSEQLVNLYFGKQLRIPYFSIRPTKEYQLTLCTNPYDTQNEYFSLEFTQWGHQPVSIKITNASPETSQIKNNQIVIVIIKQKDSNWDKEIYNLPYLKQERQELYNILHKIYEAYKAGDFETPFIEFFLLLRKLEQKQRKLKEEIENIIKELAQNTSS